MIGRNWRAPLGLLLSVNEHLGRGRALAVLTVASIATSVALATGLEMSSRSVQSEMERTADAITGPAQIEVSGGSLGIPEDILAAVQQAPGVLAASPFVEATFKLVAEEFPLHVLGIDFTADRQVHTYTVSRGGLQVGDPLRLLTRPDAVIVTESLTRRLRLGQGDSFRVRSKTAELDLRIEGILQEGELAQAFGGQVAVMDVYALMAHLGREGLFDRIDIVPEPGRNVDALITDLSERIGGRATVRRTALRQSLVDPVLGTLRLAALLVAGAGVVVACVLSYTTMALSIDRRVPQIAILRATGLEATRVRRLVYEESTLLALAGTLIGLASGLFLSRGFTALFSRFSSTMLGLEVGTIDIRPVTLGIALLVGMVVALAGSILPSRRATLRFIFSDPPPELSPKRESTILALGLLIAAAVTIMLPIAPLPKLITFFVTSLAVILSAGTLLPHVLVVLRPLLERLLPRIGHLVGIAVSARPQAIVLTVMGIAAMVGAISGLMIVLESFTRSLSEWVELRYPNAVLVTVGDPLEGRGRQLLLPDTIQMIRSTPGVSGVDEQYISGASVLYEGYEVGIAAQSMGVVAEYGHLATATDSLDVASKIAEGAVAISESFARKFGVVSGDQISLNTPKGQQEFQIAGVLRSYSTGAGTIYFDIGTFDRLWSRGGASAVVLWTNGIREGTLEEIRRRVGERQVLFFTYGDDLRRAARRQVDRFKGLLYLVIELALLLGGAAVGNLLIASVAERRRELDLLRVAGATPVHVVVLVALDGLFVSVVGSLAGLVIGLLSSFPMRDILRNSYGWSIQHSVNYPEIALVVGGMGVISVVASLYVCWSAQRALSNEVFAPE